MSNSGSNQSVFLSLFDRFFQVSARNSTVRGEVVAGLTTFLAMIYSVIVVPSMLSDAGFPREAVFIATCLVAGLGSILMGAWANLPMAIGSAISLTAFTAYSLVLGQKISVAVALGAVFWMGIVFTIISTTGIRSWILRNLPIEIAHGAGIGIGLFLLLIAASHPDVGIVVRNASGVPVALGTFTSFSVLASFVGLALIIALEKRKVPGGILLVIVAISIIGLLFDPKVQYQGVFAMPSFGEGSRSLFLSLDVMGVFDPIVLPTVLALVMTAIFDATGTIRAVAGQANLLDKQGQIINGGRALTADSVSSILAGLVGSSPAAVYIESATGTAAGGRTGLTAIVVGVLFLFTLFFAPLSYLVPAYATAPALMYVGLLMLSNVSRLDFSDFIGAMSGLVCAVFIVLTGNIVTGIMLGFATLVIGRVCAGEVKKLNVGTIIIAAALVTFYAGGWAI